MAAHGGALARGRAGLGSLACATFRPTGPSSSSGSGFTLPKWTKEPDRTSSRGSRFALVRSPLRVFEPVSLEPVSCFPGNIIFGPETDGQESPLVLPDTFRETASSREKPPTRG